MKNLKQNLSILFLGLVVMSCKGQTTNADPVFKESDNLKITSVEVTYNDNLELNIFDIKVKGTAGKSKPKAIGSVNGAPVLGYVFPTSLKPTDIGFSQAEGIVAMALTSHPDFDDTPLWDEDIDGNPSNTSEGGQWHAHWVVLNSDNRVPGGLSVKNLDMSDENIKRPTTFPGMPMYLDSPGFNVVTKGNSIKVIIPTYRMNGVKQFSYDGVTAYMQVNTGWKENNLPMLGVYEVYSVASGDLSLPYKVKK